MAGHVVVVEAMQTWVKRLLVGGVFLVLLTPLLVTESLFFPYITGKAFFFRIIVEVLFALWVALATLDHKYRPKQTILSWAVLASVVVLALASVLGVNTYRSFWSNFERMEGLVGYLHLAAYFLILISTLNTEKLWHWFFKVSVGVSVVVGFYALRQLFSGQEGIRLDGTFGNATYLAVYMLMHIGLVAWLWWESRARRWVGWIYLPVLILQISVLYNTATRGTILGLIGGVLLAGVLLAIGARANPWVRKASIIGLVVLVILVGSFWLARDSDFVKQSPVLARFASISATEATTESRLTIWQMALRGAKERPLLGWGPENFAQVFSKHYEPKLWRQEPWFDHAHNIFLDWLVNAGILGLVAYLSLYAAALYLLWRGQSDYVTKSIFTGLLAAYAFHNIFVFDNLVSAMLFFALLALIHFRSGGSSLETKPSIITTGRRAAAGVVAVVMILVCYHVNIKPLRAAGHLLDAVVKPSAQANEKLSSFQKAFALNIFGSGEATEQLISQTRAIIQDKSLPKELKQAFVDLSLARGDAQVAKFPNDARTHYIYGTFLSQIGELDEAVTHLVRAVELSPYKQAILVNLAATYLAKGDIKMAIEISKKTYDLASAFPEAKIMYALALVHDRQFVLAEQVIGDMNLDDRFINAYAAVGQYSKVLRLWQQKVEANPASAQFRFSLAAAHMYLGQRNQAITQLEEAIKMEPKVEQQARQLITEIRVGRNPLDNN